MKLLFPILLIIIFTACGRIVNEDAMFPAEKVMDDPSENPYAISIVVLGNVQDAGSPHAGCNKACCKDLFQNPDPTRMVTSLGIVDTVNHMNWMVEASPDLTRQMKFLKNHSPFAAKEVPDGIFLTHAHIGHYSGLQFLGRESMNAQQVPVYTLPRMKSFLESNGPWSQLVSLKNIILNPLQIDSTIVLSSNVKILAFTVPHRDEYSETAGYLISGPNKKALFIPDIDKWEKWDRDIIALIPNVDYAFLDATFFSGDEINNRDISEIPHPFVIESMKKFGNLPAEERNKIWFIHINHTNPLLKEKSSASLEVEKAGYHVARLGDIFEL